MAKPRPTLKAAITCDQAIKEAGTNKWTLVGTFNQILVMLPEPVEAQIEAQLKAQSGQPGAATLNISQPQMGVYFCVGNAEGTYDFEIQFVKLGTTEELLIAKLNGSWECKDRLLTTDLAVNLRNVQLPGFGRYAIKLIMDGHYIDEKQLDVLKIRPGPGTPEMA